MASYAPKTETFSKTKSLEIRVGIAAAIMILGYERMWSRMFGSVGLTVDYAFLHSLKYHDRKKNSKAAVQRTMCGKKRRRDEDYSKNTQKHPAQMNDKNGQNLQGQCRPYIIKEGNENIDKRQ